MFGNSMTGIGPGGVWSLGS